MGGRDAPPVPCNSVPDSLWFVPGFVPMGDFSEVLERLERYKISEKTKGPEGPCVVLAEREGFEPSVGCPTPDFESGTIDHSATSPQSREL